MADKETQPRPEPSAGHEVGHHGVLGAATGCAVGHHEATQHAQAQQAQRNEDRNEQLISDRRFINQLDQVRELKQFLFEEKVRFREEDLEKIDLSSLNNLAFGSSGRTPSNTEWQLLDTKLSGLASYLGDDLRRKIRIRELAVYFTALPLVFLILSLISSSIVLLPNFYDPNTTAYKAIFFIGMLAWAISQGGLGACAFLGTSVITKRVDDNEATSRGKQAEFADITDENFLRSRIIVGILFGFLLGLPFTNQSLNGLNDLLFPITPTPPPGNNAAAASTPSYVLPQVSSILVILVPFLIGFSTNLVLSILGRFVVAVETFFGSSAKT